MSNAKGKVDLDAVLGKSGETKALSVLTENYSSYESLVGNQGRKVLD